MGLEAFATKTVKCVTYIRKFSAVKYSAQSKKRLSHCLSGVLAEMKKGEPVA